jgi:hypothetical protein
MKSEPFACEGWQVAGIKAEDWVCARALLRPNMSTCMQHHMARRRLTSHTHTQ